MPVSYHGQPQFRAKLASPDLDQLRQRVLASYHLGPLDPDETRAYIEHRLTAVGWTGTPHWTQAAFAAVHQQTGGIPRRINRLCSRVLLYAALEEAVTISADAVDSTAEELQHDLEGDFRQPEQTPGSPAPMLAQPPVPAADLGSLEARVPRLETLVTLVKRLAESFAGQTPAA